MSQDIRSFFLPKGKKTEQSSREESAKKKSKKRVIAIDSDSDEHVEISPKKKRHSDSDKVVDKVKNVNVVKSSEKQSGKLKPVDLSDLFGKETFKKSSPKEVGSNKKEPEVIHSDDEFEATLTQIDEIENAALKTTKDPAAIPVVSKDQSIENDIANAQNTPQKSSRKKKKEKHLEVEKVTESKISDEIPSGSSKIQTPFKTSNNLDTSFGSPSDPLEKKRQQALSYMKYLHRGGPKHPGSKEIPEGKPDCLSGLTFVITGVLDSLEREEAARIVEKYGGKVTSSVSRNTSYLVYGEEAGQSKLTKAESLGTPKINEDGLLKLIVNRSASALSPKETSNVSKKAKKRIKVEKSIDDERNKATKQLKIENSGNEMQDASYSKQNKIESNCSELKLDKTSDSSVQSSLNKSKIIEFPVVGSSSQSHSTVSVESSCVNSSLWVDKYKPTKTKQIIGQQGDRSALKKLTFWLENWHKNHIGKKKLVKPSPWAKNDDGSFFKAALLSGPPGIGKTTMAHLVSKELGFDIVEFNASDTRSKKNLHQEITELLSTKTLVGFFKPDSEDHKTSIKHVLIMDEVDGMAGNEDRGGVQELIQLIKSTRIPIICMCNDRNHPKIRSLANYCFDLRVMKPRLEQIRGAMMSVCYKESIKIPADSLNDIISGTNFDIRQILHSLCLWTAKDKHLSKEDLSKGSIKPRKDMKMGPWDVVKKVFSVDDHKDMSIHDKSDLFFHDYSINPLFVQENYLSVTPAATRGNIARTLDCIASAADSISMGDVVEKCIRSRGAWSLLPMQAMYSSVIPGTVMEGYMRGQITFPAWLGKNSRTGKLDRLLQELHVHTRLTTSGSKQALNLEYLPHIRGAILHPLITDGSSGVPVTLQVLQSYNLLREDLESILELTMWPNQRDPMSAVDSKVKAALTRAYNKEGILTPYSVVSVIKKRSGERSVDELNETGEGEEEEEEQPDDINNDAMITKKAKKSDAKKTDKKSDEISGKAACGKSKNPIDINSKISQKKGRGKEK